MAKLDLPNVYLNSRRPDSVRFHPRPGTAPKNRTPIPRLGWLSGKSAIQGNEEQLTKMLNEHALDSAVVFVDTCFIRSSNFSADFWKTLIGKQIAITEGVWRELELWITQPLNNRNEWLRIELDRQRREHDPTILFLEAFDDADLEKACEYYKRVLGYRKRVESIARSRSEHKLKRTATAEEVFREVQRMVGQRGIQLAKDGLKAGANEPNLLNDEDIVVRAVLFALSTGREVTILTSDRGLHEQFYKLMYLIDTNYRSWLIGNEFRREPDNFLISNENPDAFNYFGLEDCVQIALPHGHEKTFLPPQFNFVMVNCLRFGAANSDNTTFSQLGFCSETEMLEVVKVKGRTDGLNTELLNGKNCLHHISHAISLGGIGLVAAEKSVRDPAQRASIADLNSVLFSGEGTSHIDFVQGDEDSEVSSEELATAESLLSFSPDRRLTVTPVPTLPHELSSNELAYTFKMIDPSSLISLDSSAIQYAWPDGIANALLEKPIAVDPDFQGMLSKTLFDDSAARTHWPSNAIKSWDLDFAFRYYRTLIAQKRLVGRTIARKIDTGLSGRERRRLWRSEVLSFNNGESFLKRASSGLNDTRLEKLLADDFSLVNSMLTAIVEGADLYFITMRPSVFEQFYTMVQLLVTHYDSFYLADSIYKNGQRFNAPEANASMNKMGLETNMLRSTVKLEKNWFLPKAPYPMRLNCWLLFPSFHGSKFYFRHGCFLAERPMWRLLRTKSDTNGLNSGHHGDFNFRMKRKSKTKGEVGIAREQKKRLREIYPSISESICKHLLNDVSLHDLIDVQNNGDPIKFPW